MEKKQILQQALMQLNAFVREQRQLVSSENVFSLSEQTSMEKTPITLSGVDMGQNFSVIVQAWAPQKDINALISQIKSMPVNAILFADFVNPVMAKKFRQRSIAFVGCAGKLSIKNK